MTQHQFSNGRTEAVSTVSIIRAYAPLALTAIAAVLLSLEYGLQKTGHGGLCPTAGCALVGTFVKYGQTMFIGLGLFFFWILFSLLFLEKRLDNIPMGKVITIVLTAGLAFDGAILGFQRFGIQEACVLCYMVGVSLFLILAAYGWLRRRLTTVILGVAVWSAGFASQALFVFPEQTPDLRQAVLISFQPAQAREEQIFLFFSLHCDHCTMVMASLAAHPPQGGQWRLVPLDTEPDDQRKLSALLNHPLAGINPFSAILALKNTAAPNMDIAPTAVEAPRRGKTFLRNSGYRQIPLMLVQETPSRRVVLQGPEAILNYLLERGLIPSRLTF